MTPADADPQAPGDITAVLVPVNGDLTTISLRPGLDVDTAQRAVDGYVRMAVATPEVVLLVDEDAALTGKPLNRRASAVFARHTGPLWGPVLILGPVHGEEASSADLVLVHNLFGVDLTPSA